MSTTVPAPPATIESFEEALRENPSDYYKWEEYIARLEADGDKNKIKEAYERLLNEFPLMYGFWKKLADVTFEVENGAFDVVIQVYEKAVEQSLYSVEMWTHYCVFVAEKSNDLNQIRSTFERAVNKVGNDFLAHALWDQYIDFETSQDDFLRLSLVYERLLQIPLRDLTRYHSKYKTYASSRTTAELATPDQIQQLMQTHQLDEAVRIAISDQRDAYYTAAAAELERIKPFESAVERPYFHVQPMDEKQLQNWRRYLTIEESRPETSVQRMNHLYQKCLVSCCLYVEFWSRYVRYLEAVGSLQDASDILSKLITLYRRNDQSSHILYAQFEERAQHVDNARAIYANLIQGIGKSHVESALQYIYFERRNATDQQQIAQLFSTLQEGMDVKSRAYMQTQLAKYYISKNELENARLAYQQLTSGDGAAHVFVWLSLIEMEAGLPGVDANDQESRLDPLLHVVSSSALLSNADKIKVLKRLLEYALSLGKDLLHARQIESKVLALESETEEQGEARGVKRKADESVDDRDTKVARSASPNTLAQQYAMYAAYQQQQQQYAAYAQQTQQQPDAYAQYYAQQ
ncbi:pre-mRNA-processing factor 39 [Acrasis kona]|uniref:Pre-mRNA-processing factor 39 n=1 Tax=Acrasis kona TaxID=1008807 RepID=A0AAW2YWK9_9EUKA